LVLTVGISVRLQELGFYKPSLPPVPEDTVDRAARRVAAEKKKEKKDTEKARAHERIRARDALERRRRRQERDGLSREPSPETPDVGAKVKTPPFARGLRRGRWSNGDKTTGKDTLCSI
jgi:hypothetical protein